MRYVLLIFLGFYLSGCAKPCRGVYTETDEYGNLKKFDEHESAIGCVKDSVSLSAFEQSLERRNKKGVTCQPQTLSRTLVAQNNFYTYRDGRMYLDLNSNGEFRRLTLAEGKDGQQAYTRLQGCFYERSGQLLLDTTDAASSQYFDPSEVFSYTSTATTMEMVRFDDSSDWDGKFCPYLDTPWGFCDLLRNGNDMFFPTLTAAQQASLLSDALLIRKQFNFANASKSDFESLWSGQGEEKTAQDYKYAVQAVVDTPRYIDQAWMDYIRGNSPEMPDTTSSRMPPICYPARRTVTLADGTEARIDGEVCYVDGQYVFTQ